MGALGVSVRWTLPGVAPTLGLTLTYLGAIVLIPLAGLAVKAAGLGRFGFLATLLQPRTIAAFRVSFGLSITAAALNAVIGLLLAWVLASAPLWHPKNRIRTPKPKAHPEEENR